MQSVHHSLFYGNGGGRYNTSIDRAIDHKQKAHISNFGFLVYTNNAGLHLIK
jgi:hypothetical protein